MTLDEPTNVEAGGEIPLGGEQEAAPVSLKTSEFQFPIGDEVPLPEDQDDPASVFERIIDESDFLPAWFLVRGAEIQSAVGRVVLTQPVSGLQPGDGWATGFMVSPSLFMTNNHVIPNKPFADKVRVQFNYQLGPDGTDAITEYYTFDADDVFHTNPALDFTLIRLRGNESEDVDVPRMPGNVWGFIALNDAPIFRSKQHFNIVQHPSGRRKEVALQDNEIDRLFTNVVRYKADTEPGSSGSPVFDNLWQLVALHHAGGDRDASGKWLNNEGIRIDAVINDLRAHFAAEGRQDVLDELGI
jgi:endonuclease G